MMGPQLAEEVLKIFRSVQREGDRAFKAFNYRESVKAKKLSGELEGGDAIFFADLVDGDLEGFDWVDFPFFQLAR